jgi:hypothetical protein
MQAHSRLSIEGLFGPQRLDQRLSILHYRLGKGSGVSGYSVTVQQSASHRGISTHLQMPQLLESPYLSFPTVYYRRVAIKQSSWPGLPSGGRSCLRNVSKASVLHLTDSYFRPGLCGGITSYQSSTYHRL